MKMVFKNQRGDQLSLSDNNYFYLVNIDAQTELETDISSSTVGNIDGDLVSNVRTQPRIIVLDLRINPSVSVEDAKRAILSVIKLKKNGTLIWTQNDRTVTITGIVDGISMPRWNEAVTMQVSMHCSSPYWEDIEQTVSQINEIIALHYFTEIVGDMLYFPEEGIVMSEYDTIRTKQFYNAGDVEVGMDIEIIALDTVTNPIILDEYGNYFGLGYTGRDFTMQVGDVVYITTHRGNKTVTLNKATSLYDKIKPGSTWLKIDAGDTTFSINSDDDSLENMCFNIRYRQQYV